MCREIGKNPLRTPNNRRLGLRSAAEPRAPSPEPRAQAAACGLRVHPPRRGGATAWSCGRVDRRLLASPRLQSRRARGQWGRRIPLPPRGHDRGRDGPAETGSSAARSERAAGGGGSHSAPQVEGGARAGEGSRGTAADSDPGRAGPRRSAAATRSPGARKCALDPAPAPARPPARSRWPEKKRTATSESGRRRAGATPSAPGGGGGGRPWLPNLRPGPSHRRPRAGPAASVRVPRPGSGPVDREGTSGGGGQESRAYLCADRWALCPGPGAGDRGRGRQGRHSGGGGPSGAECGRSGSRCLGRAPSGARPALPALAVEGAASSAPNWIPTLTQLRVGPLYAGTLPPLSGCPRPPARWPARPSVSLTQAHTPRAGAPRSRSHTQRCSRLSRVLYPLTRTF